MNCVANGRVLREGPFKDIWIQPAAGDAGGALGAAATVWHVHDDQAARRRQRHDACAAATSARASSRRGDHARSSTRRRASTDELDDDELLATVAELLEQENVIGWFQGRMEFGPRALGGRSIIGDARSAKMQSVMNLKIKYRESFRPFAPSVLAERVGDYFEQNGPSPYMLIVAPVRERAAHSRCNAEQQQLFGIEKLKLKRSRAAGDHPCRLLGAHPDRARRHESALSPAAQGVRAPAPAAACSSTRRSTCAASRSSARPTDAYRCFMRTEMDYLVVENFVLDKREQPVLEEDDAWRATLDLD